MSKGASDADGGGAIPEPVKRAVRTVAQKAPTERLPGGESPR